MTSFALVKDYLVYSTDAGLLSHFYIDEWEFVSKYTHATGIKKIFPEPFGMSIAFIDDASEGFIYNPVNSNVVKIPNMPATTQGLVWEAFEPEKWILIAYNGENVTTFVYSKYTVEGPSCMTAGSMRQPYSSLPLLLFRGVLIFLDASGKIVQMKLDSHTHDTTLEGLEEAELIEKMKKVSC